MVCCVNPQAPTFSGKVVCNTTQIIMINLFFSFSIWMIYHCYVIYIYTKVRFVLSAGRQLQAILRSVPWLNNLLFEIWDYLVNRQNPLIMFIYLLLVVGGYAIFHVEVRPLIPAESFHTWAAPLITAIALLSWARVTWSDPGRGLFLSFFLSLSLYLIILIHHHLLALLRLNNLFDGHAW